MQITENKRGAVTVFELDGRLDTVTSADLDKKIMSLLSNGEKYLCTLPINRTGPLPKIRMTYTAL
jgi:hypothetical protein